MTTDRSDAGLHFAWNDDVRIRVERRARELRRRRRSVFGLVSGVVAMVAVGMVAATIARSGTSGERVATTAPDPAVALARLLPAPSSVTGVLPELHVKEVSGGPASGALTPAELVGAEGAVYGVTRQWVSGTGSVELRPGQRFPDEVVTVISSIVSFDTAADAQAWITQAVARASMPVDLPVDGTAPSDLVVLRGAGDSLGELQYLAFFSDGDTAFSLLMVAGGSGGHDSEFARLAQDWLRQTGIATTPSTTDPGNVSGGGGPATSPPGSRR